MSELKLVLEDSFTIPVVLLNGDKSEMKIPDRYKTFWEFFVSLSTDYDVIIDNGKVILSEKSWDLVTEVPTSPKIQSQIYHTGIHRKDTKVFQECQKWPTQQER